MIQTILNNINQYLLSSVIEILPGNYCIGKGQIQGEFVELRYVNNSQIYFQHVIDDVWSEDLIWDSLKTKYAKKQVVYLLHPSIQIESESIILHSNLIVSKYFSQITKFFIPISLGISEACENQFPGLQRDPIESLFSENNLESPKVSIITSVFNNALLLEQTIQSVINQSCSNFEFVIKDACSTDNFNDVIEKYKPYISKIISTKDKGVYYGMHEGILASKGEYIACLNSDDFFAGKNVLQNVIKELQITHSNALYGDIVMYSNYDFIYKNGNINRLAYETSIYHPSLFIDRESYFDCGGFDFTFKIAADVDLIIKMKSKHKQFDYLPKNFTVFRLGGTSTITWRSYKEELRARLSCKKYLMQGFFYITLKNLKHIIINSYKVKHV